MIPPSILSREIRFRFRPSTLLFLCALAAILDIAFQGRTSVLGLPLGAVPARPMNVLLILLDPLPWVASWVAWRSIVREYTTRRSEVLHLSFLSSGDLFVLKYVPLSLLTLLVVGVAKSLIYGIYGLFVIPRSLGMSAFALNWWSGRLWAFGMGHEWVILALGAPLFQWFVMARFPKRPQSLRNLLLGGLLLQFALYVCFYGGMMSAILLSASRLWPENLVSSPMLRLPVAALFWGALILAPLGWWLARRFRRLFDLHDFA